MSEHCARRCRPIAAGTPALTRAQIDAHLAGLPGWSYEPAGVIVKTFGFADFHRTMAFVNAVAWIAHREDHHPDMKVGYNRCRIELSTHSIGGISENDFICAAEIEALRP